LLKALLKVIAKVRSDISLPRQKVPQNKLLKRLKISNFAKGVAKGGAKGAAK
jgi:hypothetical protein